MIAVESLVSVRTDRRNASRRVRNTSCPGGVPLSYQQCIMTVRLVRLAKEAHYSRGSLHMPGREKAGEEARMAVKSERHFVTASLVYFTRKDWHVRHHRVVQVHVLNHIALCIQS